MNPGPALVLACPHCGGKKHVINISSGNTIGRVVWSDRKDVMPMLPQASYIQKCPHCGRYYYALRQMTQERGSSFCLDKGELPYAELKEAWKELSCLEDLTQEEKQGTLIMLVWSFNDEFTREVPVYSPNAEQEEPLVEVKKEIPAEEQEYIASIVRQLVSLDIDDLFKADLLREIGEFDEALKCLGSLETDDDFWKDVQKKTKEKIEVHDTLPFVIFGN